jgi:hypothetical protein
MREERSSIFRRGYEIPQVAGLSLSLSGVSETGMIGTGLSRIIGFGRRIAFAG